MSRASCVPDLDVNLHSYNETSSSVIPSTIITRCNRIERGEQDTARLSIGSQRPYIHSRLLGTANEEDRQRRFNCYVGLHFRGHFRS